MSVSAEVTLRWKPKVQTVDGVSRGISDLMHPRGEIELRKLIVFSCLPRKDDQILYHPDPAEVYHLPLATVEVLVWKLCNGPEPGEYRPFILARPDGGEFEVPGSEVFAPLFKHGWKVVNYDSGLQNRLVLAVEEAGLGSGIPMWKSPIK